MAQTSHQIWNWLTGHLKDIDKTMDHAPDHIPKKMPILPIKCKDGRWRMPKRKTLTIFTSRTINQPNIRKLSNTRTVVHTRKNCLQVTMYTSTYSERDRDLLGYSWTETIRTRNLLLRRIRSKDDLAFLPLFLSASNNNIYQLARIRYECICWIFLHISHQSNQW